MTAALLIVGTSCSGSEDVGGQTQAVAGASKRANSASNVLVVSGLDDVASRSAQTWPGKVIVAHAAGSGVQAFAEPNEQSTIVNNFANPRETGADLVFQAALGPEPSAVDSLGQAQTVLSADGNWLKVLLPVRPNGSTGWVRLRDVELSANPYRIEVNASDFSLRVFKENVLQFETRVGIGVGDTPTPYGHFYTIELLQPTTAGGPYGPYAFGLSAFSETLEKFRGGEAIIGIHGTDVPERLGTEVSSGCIRVSNDVISGLAKTIPLGTPVVITRQSTIGDS